MTRRYGWSIGISGLGVSFLSDGNLKVLNSSSVGLVNACWVLFAGLHVNQVEPEILSIDDLLENFGDFEFRGPIDTELLGYDTLVACQDLSVFLSDFNFLETSEHSWYFIYDTKRSKMEYKYFCLIK